MSNRVASLPTVAFSSELMVHSSDNALDVLAFIIRIIGARVKKQIEGFF